MVQSAALQPLSGLDALFLQLESAEMPMHVGSLNLLELPAGFRGDFAPRVRELLRGRLHLAPAFTRRLVGMPLGIANPAWTDADDIDLARHVRSITLPKPGSLAQLEACVARLHAQRLDRSRPLWQLTLIHGLGGTLKGCVGYYAKVHHAAVDGQAGVALAQALLDVTPEPRAVPPPARRGRRALPGPLERLQLAARSSARQWRELAKLLPEAARALAGGLTASAAPGTAAPAGAAKRGRFHLIGPRTPLNVAVSERRAFSTASVPLDDVKFVAKSLGVSINDVVLATCSGALRRWLAGHGGVPAKSLTAGVPFSVRTAGDASASNQVSMMLADLATQIADPAARLAAIHATMSRGKAVTGQLRALVPTDYPSLGAAWLVGGVARAAAALGHRLLPGTHLPSPAQVAISNVPGPPLPLYLAGARLRHYWPLSIVVHGVALNITVQSYDGQVDFGLVACPQAVPDLSAFRKLLAAAFDELHALAQAAPQSAAPAGKPAPAAKAAGTSPAAKRPAPRRRTVEAAQPAAGSPAPSTDGLKSAVGRKSARKTPISRDRDPRSAAHTKARSTARAAARKPPSGRTTGSRRR